MIDYTPEIPEFPVVNPFLPCYGKFDLTTYIQGASDYEIMSNLVQLYNTMAIGYNKVEKLSVDTVKAYKQLQSFINDIFTDPDLNKVLQNVLNNMLANGEMIKYLEPFMGFVSPEMFGCKGDGVTDDSTNFNRCIEYAELHNIPIKCVSNSYALGNFLNIHTANIDFNYSTLKNTNVNSDYVIKIGDDGTDLSNIPDNCNITNVTIDCNSGSGIQIKAKHAKLFNCNILNIGGIGIDNHLGYENSFNTIYFSGDKKNNNKGFVANTGDAEIYNIIGVNLITAIELFIDQRITNAHFWIGDINLYKGSIFCKTHCFNAAKFVNSNCDTYETFLYLDKVAPGWSLTNVDVIYNTAFIPNNANTVLFNIDAVEWKYYRPYSYTGNIVNCTFNKLKSNYHISNITHNDKYMPIRIVNTSMAFHTLDSVDIFTDFTNTPSGYAKCYWGSRIELYIENDKQFANGTITESSGINNTSYYGFKKFTVNGLVINKNDNTAKTVPVNIVPTNNNSSFYIASTYRLQENEKFVISAYIPLTDVIE